jgi:ABC-2 type transport system ATP-binding protein
LIALEGLSRIYANGRGVSDIDLELGPGIHGLIGPNGAGKTTIIKLLMGLLVPDAGRVLFDGRDIAREGDGFSWRRDIGYFPAEDYFFEYLSGRQNLEYLGLLKCGDKKAYVSVARILAQFGIEEYWDEPFAAYSSGMKKKIELAGSLIGEPSILVWDEPTNGVDIMGNLLIRDFLEGCRAAGRVVLLSSHVIEFLDGLIDTLTVIDEGRLRLHASPPPLDLKGAFLEALGRGGESPGSLKPATPPASPPVFGG